MIIISHSDSTFSFLKQLIESQLICSSETHVILLPSSQSVFDDNCTPIKSICSTASECEYLQSVKSITNNYLKKIIRNLIFFVMNVLFFVKQNAFIVVFFKKLQHLKKKLKCKVEHHCLCITERLLKLFRTMINAMKFGYI